MLFFCVSCQAEIQKLPKTHKTGPIIIRNSPVMRIPDLTPLPEGSWVRLHNVEVVDRSDSWVRVKHPGAPETIKVYSEQHLPIGDHILVSGQLTTDDGLAITTFCGDAQHKLQGYLTPLSPYQYQVGTINYAMEQPDQSKVSLSAVGLDRIRNLTDGTQLITCSTNDSLSILVLLLTKIPMLKTGLTLDVEGTIIRLPNKDTVIVNPKVTGYQNESGTELTSIPPLPNGTISEQYTKLVLCSPATDFIVPTSFDSEVKITWITPISYSSIAMLLKAKPTTGTYIKLHMLRVSSLGSKPGKYMVLKDQPTVSGGKSILLYTARSLNSSSIVESVTAKIYTVSTTTVLLADDSDPRFDPQTDIGSVNVIN
jgi:hypothetical protein